MPDKLTLSDLRDAVAGSGGAFRRRVRLQPAGGSGDKVFPPTYVGAVYAIERRHVDGEVKECAVLDSVQSQANRIEEALQDAVDDGRLRLPLVVVDFSGIEGLEDIGRVTSLEAPHRIVDAILRDSELDGLRFRESEMGRHLNEASIRNATPVFDLSPVSLVFGLWDSHGPKGGLGAKFERAMVSEIVAFGVEYGVRTGGRIDPLGIQREAATVFATPEGGWTLDEKAAARDKGKPRKVGGQRGEGKPSEIGHGNVAPGFGTYTKSVGIRDPLSANRDALVREGNVAPGGVTMDFALQTTVLSLPVLRRLRFPIDGTRDTNADTAARVSLVALALCGATLSGVRGYDLRSRCALWPETNAPWELLVRPGQGSREFDLDPVSAIQLVEEAAESARKAGLAWNEKPVTLRPSAQLVELVRRSRTRPAQGAEEDES